MPIKKTSSSIKESGLPHFSARYSESRQSVPDWRPRILIVDDKVENLFVLEELLEGLEAEIVRADSGNAALAELLSNPLFHLILMDVQMPDLDGFTTVELIRQHPKTQHIPVIFITAIYKDSENVYKGYQSGCVDYMCKPIDTKLLLAKVEVFLDLEYRKFLLSQLHEKTQRLEKHHRLLLNHTQEGIIGVSPNGFIEYSNPAAQALLSYEEGELDGLAFLQIIYGHNNQITWSNSSFFKAIGRSQSLRNDDTLLYGNYGQQLNCCYSFGSFEDRDTQGGVLLFKDISSQKQAEHALLHVATHDPLTNLPNRILFRSCIQSAMKRVEHTDSILNVMIVDLDQFKLVNDDLGHATGDEVLMTVANRLQHFLANDGVLARLGGDEFGIIREFKGHFFQQGEFIEQLIELLNSPVQVNEEELTLSCSIGVVKFPGYGIQADDLIKAADIALYQAKLKGRNTWALFESDFENKAVQRSQIERDLKVAINCGQLCCHYQPILDACTGDLSCLEVLVRWQHPDKGQIMPNRFIPVAESAALIGPLGEEVAKQAMTELNGWLQKGLWPSGARLALNMSTSQFCRGGIADQIKLLANETKIDLSLIEIEITETSLMSEPQEGIRCIQELNALGIDVSIDDFGTGHSSLAYLKKLPISKLKIDRTFVKDIGQDSNDEFIIKATIDLAHNLKLKVVAEGIETDQQENFLKSVGTDFFQGFKYSKPLNCLNIEHWLTKYQQKTKENDVKKQKAKSLKACCWLDSG